MTNRDTHEIRQPNDLKAMAMGDLAHFGLNEIAYVKPVTYGGERAFAIHSADGAQLAVTVDHATAVAMIEQNEMRAASLH